LQYVSTLNSIKQTSQPTSYVPGVAKQRLPRNPEPLEAAQSFGSVLPPVFSAFSAIQHPTIRQPNSPKGATKLPANVLCKRAFPTYLLAQFFFAWLAEKQKKIKKFALQPRKMASSRKLGKIENIGKVQRSQVFYCNFSFGRECFWDW